MANSPRSCRYCPNMAQSTTILLQSNDHFIFFSHLVRYFQGKHYWKTIRFQLQAGYPRLISDGFRGLDEQRFFTGHLDAAFVYSGDNHTYFIKDAMVWRLNSFKEFTSSIDNDYPQFVARWLHIGEKITGALRWINGRNYFFSHRSYYRFDHIHHRVRKMKMIIDLNN